jgi:hypothetical protein
MLSLAATLIKPDLEQIAVCRFLPPYLKDDLQ